MIRAAVCLFGVLSGCAMVTVEQEFSKVSQEALSRTGQTVSWEQTPDDIAWTQQAVQELLQDGPTRERQSPVN